MPVPLMLYAKFIGAIFISATLFSCNSSSNQKHVANEANYRFDSLIIKDTFPDIEVLSQTKKISKPDTLEQRLIDAGLVDIQKIDSSIHVDLKYSSTDNFMQTDLYGNLNKVYLQEKVARRLAESQSFLKTKDSTLSLLVFDGVRPRSVQQRMWNALDTIPFQERIKFVSNPKNGSIHNYGCAVDLTILNLETGDQLDMGAGYDDLRKIAYPRFEEHFLESGELTKKQYQNRKLLRSVMRKGGFWNIQTEWWHFNAYSREKAKELYEIVE